MTGPDSEGLQAEAISVELEGLLRRVARPVLGDRDLLAADAAGLLVRYGATCQPSVGAVPVEVPEDVVDAAAMAIGCYSPEQYERWRHTSKGQQAHDRALAGLQEAYPLIAARVRAEAVADERQRMASLLVELLTGIVPADTIRWDAAVEMLGAELRANRDHDAQVRAEERRRVLAVMEQPAFMQAAMDRAQLTCFTDDDGQDIGIMPGSHAAVAIIAARTELLAAGSAVPVATPQRPEIVVLCGSTRFKDAFREAAKSEALAGRIVLTVSDLDPRPEMRNVNVPIDADTKARLDQLHRHKIDLADRVLVLNVGGYIGESTRSEIEYATAHGKPISYLEDVS